MSRFESAAQRIRNLQYPVLMTANPAERLRGRLSHGALSQQATLQYSNATQRFIWTPVDGGIYWNRTTLDTYASGFWGMGLSYMFRLLNGTPNTDGSITYVGGAWTHDASVGALNGTRSWPDTTAGRYAEFQITGTKRIYVALTTRSNGGYAVVTIDGATTLVRGPSVTDLGALKVINCYTAATVLNNWFEIARDLDPAVTYTVRLTTNANVPPGSAGVRFYVEGYGVPCLNFEEANGTLVADTVPLTLLVNVNNWGYAYLYTPTGAAGSEFTGSAHLNEAITAVQWLDGEGVDVSVSVGTPLQSANLIRLVQTGASRHSETGATDIAQVNMVLYFNWQGVRQYVSHTWLVTGVMNHGYIAMLPGHTTLLKGAIAGSPIVYALTDNDDSNKGEKRSRLVMLFDATHDFVTYAYVPHLKSVDFWAYSSLFAHIDDGAATNKIYFHRWFTGTPRTWGIGDVWTAEFWFGFGWKPGFTP